MKNHYHFNECHVEWHEILNNAIQVMDDHYLNELQNTQNWLPSRDRLFSAFTAPLSQTQYILLGESPYPRPSSANGYAFWDNAVESLWSPMGLSKEVNKATSLRNLIKMLLVARRDLDSDVSQQAIAGLDKGHLVSTAQELFLKMMSKGIVLLNASLVYSEGKVPYHSRQWKPFINSLLEQLSRVKPTIQLILLGKIAESVAQDKLPVGLLAEHPYNVSFITNQQVLNFFNPLDLLSND